MNILGKASAIAGHTIEKVCLYKLGAVPVR